MIVLRLLCVLAVSSLVRVPRGEAQVPTEQPELIEGPWEVATASGIDGIFFEIVTSSSGPTGAEQFDWQTISIRVYHREGGKETWGYFGTKEKLARNPTACRMIIRLRFSTVGTCAFISLTSRNHSIGT